MDQTKGCKVNQDKEITIWRKWYKDEKGRKWHEHNHIEDGLVSNDKPIGHPSWKNESWIKSFGRLIKRVVYETRQR